MEDEKLKELQKKVKTLAQSYGLSNAGFFGSGESKEGGKFVGFYVEVKDAVDVGFNTARFYQFTRETLRQYLCKMESIAQGKEK